jgi:signal transduction histidine kinase/DNA-binding response OmpR family regulator
MNVMNTTATTLEQNALSQNDKSNRLIITIISALLTVMTLLTVGGLFYAWRRSKNALKLQQEAQKMRSHFIDNITHELRTPLSVVISAGEQMREGVKTTNEESRRMGDIIYSHGNNMLQLVNQLIDIDHLREPGATDDLTIRNGDIVMFVRLLVENYTERAQQEQIMLEFTSPLKSLTVTFTTEHIRRIIHLLLENAFKFTPPGGSIKVGTESPEKGLVRLSVFNTGDGIPVQEREHIFEPFSQGDTNFEGVGPVVHLALVKQLVKSMHGTIDINTETGRGTAISINLPLTLSEADAIQPFAERRLHQGDAVKNKPLVFIVENTDDVAFFIGNRMRQDYELRFANDGLEALQNALNLAPDLIITNMTLPVMDGKELIRRLREDDALSHIPVIAMTSSDSEQERLSCLQAGADAVLVKPFNSAELLLLAQRLISRHDIIRERFAKPAASSGNEIATTQMSKEDKVFINRLVDVIHVQMAKGDIDMDRIAAAMSVSRKMLRQRVMDITGLTPVTFALQVRLKRASRMLLSNEEIPLSTIASKCGFQTPSHFSKSFKQLYGISPIQYRKNGDNLNIIDHPG